MAISSLVLWIAGMMMCDGFSPASWTMYSPMSDSSASMPAASAAWFSSISSLTIDLPLTISLAACFWQMPRMISLASSGVSAQWTWMPLRARFSSSCTSRSGSLPRLYWRMCSPSVRRLSSSSASGNWAARLVIRKSIAPRKLWRRKGLSTTALARSRKPSDGLKWIGSAFMRLLPSAGRPVPSGRVRRRPASPGCRRSSRGRR